MPNYLQAVISKLSKRDWLLHNFEITDNNELYLPQKYLLNTKINYVLKLDANIYQYIIQSHKKEKSSEDFKDSIALIIFCQLANINIDPQYAIYEKLNYSTDNFLLDEILDDLEIFRQIDNTPTDELAKYLLGETTSYKVIEKSPIDREAKKISLTKYERLEEWDSLYLIVLFITYCYCLKKLSNFEKLKFFLKLMIKDFRKSLPCFIFALIFFGKSPAKKMMKFKISDNKQKKLQDIKNMTWDLYFVNRFFREQQNKELLNEYIYASNDQALKKIIKTALNYQNTNDYHVLSDHWNVEKLEEIEMYYKDLSAQKRSYLSSDWGPEHRQKLIFEYERKLGLQ